jgi:phosphatidylserine/phosphatidylglycerophosphate/cardiolipin synthase-like enzyme
LAFRNHQRRASFTAHAQLAPARADLGRRQHYLSNAGIPVWVDTRVSIAHNKVIVLDGKTVITGSFNFTAAAQAKNADNLLVIRDAELAARYRANWENRRAVSVPYGGPVEGAAADE